RRLFRSRRCPRKQCSPRGEMSARTSRELNAPGNLSTLGGNPMRENVTEQPLTLLRLRQAVTEDAAIRFYAKLQPAAGPGDKVFPPTYVGGQYALERRVDKDGVGKTVVLLDSVQSQANRMEQALLAAHRAQRITLPMISVSFSGDLQHLAEITVLDAP